MQGLLDFVKTPAGQGLLSGLFGYAANAQRGTPVNNIGRGGLAGMIGYSNALDRVDQDKNNQFMQQYRQMQMDQMRGQMEQQSAERARLEAQQAWRARLPELLNPSPVSADQAINQGGRVGPTAEKAAAIGTTPAVDQAALQAFLLDPHSPFADRVIEQKLFPKEPEAFTLSPGQVRFQGGQEVAALPEKINPNQPFMIKDGQIVPNEAFQQFELNKAQRGASRVNTTVNTGNTIDSTIAKGVGEQVNNSLTTARSAEAQIGTLNNLRRALDSGKVFAGPTSTFQQYGAQLADVLGVAGKDTKEKLSNTRLAMQSAAQLELDAAEQMRGQGAITENERGIIRRAAAGEVDKMTVTELRTLTDALTKIASNKIERHNQYAAPVVQRNETLAPMLQIQPPQVYQWQNSVMRQPQAPQQGGVHFLGFE